MTPTLLDASSDDDETTRIYSLKAPMHSETIRVAPSRTSAVTDRYRVDRLTVHGWTHLLDGKVHRDEPIDYADAIDRAARVLGMDDDR